MGDFDSTSPKTKVGKLIRGVKDMDSTCTTNINCYHIQWDIHEAPTSIKRSEVILPDNSVHVFDGFYILSHRAYIDIPEFKYWRNGIKCSMKFIKVSLPPELELNLDPEYNESLDWFNKYLFEHVMGFTENPFESLVGIYSEYLPKVHLYPRYLHVDFSMAYPMDSIGYLKGKCLVISKIVETIKKTTQVRLSESVEFKDPTIDSIGLVVRVDGHSPAVRIDGFYVSKNNTEEKTFYNVSGGNDELRNATSKSKISKWQQQGDIRELEHLSKQEQKFQATECCMSGFNSDIIEIASAMPLLHEFLSHHIALIELESILGVSFVNRQKLRQACTHTSFVDLSCQSSNTSSGLMARERCGYRHASKSETYQTSQKRKQHDIDFNERLDEKKEDRIRNIAFQYNLYADYQSDENNIVHSYERLEFLGDSILGFIVSSMIYLKIPEFNEEQLTKARSIIVNNDTLSRLGICAGIHKFILTGFRSTHGMEEMSSHIVADAVEAIFGAVYLEQGIDACRKVLKILLGKADSAILDMIWLSNNEMKELTKKYVSSFAPSNLQSDAGNYQESFANFKKLVDLPVENVGLWLQAMTHKSYEIENAEETGSNSKSFFNYERIEFLGDSVLQFLTSQYVMNCLPHHQEMILTGCRSSLVKNSCLGKVGEKLGYRKFVRMRQNIDLSEFGLRYLSVLADVFEAILGTIYLESGLNKALEVLEAHLFPQFEEIVKHREWESPSIKLISFLKRLPGNIRWRCEKIRSTGPCHQSIHGARVIVENYTVARAKAKTFAEAKELACNKALLLFGGGRSTMNT